MIRVGTSLRLKLFFVLLPIMLVAADARALSIGLSMGHEKHYKEAEKFFSPELRYSWVLTGYLESIYTFGKWVNYRASLGRNEYRDAARHKVNFDGYMMVHTVGFKLFQEHSMRLWIGPQIRAYYYNKFARGTPGHSYKGGVFAATVGATIGYHWYASRSFAVGLNGGLWLGNYWGSYREYDDSGQRLRKINADKSMLGSFQEFYIMVNF